MRITVRCLTCSSQSSMHLCHFSSAKLFMPVKWNCYVLSFQPRVYHRLHFMIVRIADTTKKIFRILKQIIVTVRQVTSVCGVILLYEAGVMNSLLGDCLCRDFCKEYINLFLDGEICVSIIDYCTSRISMNDDREFMATWMSPDRLWEDRNDVFQTQNFPISQILPSIDIWHLFGLISRIPADCFTAFFFSVSVFFLAFSYRYFLPF